MGPQQPAETRRVRLKVPCNGTGAFQETRRGLVENGVIQYRYIGTGNGLYVLPVFTLQNRFRGDVSTGSAHVQEDVVGVKGLQLPGGIPLCCAHPPQAGIRRQPHLSSQGPSCPRPSAARSTPHSKPDRRCRHRSRSGGTATPMIRLSPEPRGSSTSRKLSNTSSKVRGLRCKTSRPLRRSSSTASPCNRSQGKTRSGFMSSTASQSTLVQPPTFAVSSGERTVAPTSCSSAPRPCTISVLEGAIDTSLTPFQSHLPS